MKKILALVLALAMVLTLVGCTRVKMLFLPDRAKKTMEVESYAVVGDNDAESAE